MLKVTKKHRRDKIFMSNGLESLIKQKTERNYQSLPREVD